VGIGFSTVTLLLPLSAAFAVLTAVTVSGFGEGKAAGAVYKPPLVICPTVALPPAMPLTDQVTFWLICAPAVPVPETVAENC
jgi:hypothetical protein